MLDQEKLAILKNKKGFITALDQSRGSTPKALKAYGIPMSSYQTEEEMFYWVHQLRIRILESPAFDSEKIIASILYEDTVKREVAGLFTADFLWQKKGIIPFLKIDRGLDVEDKGVQKLNPITDLPDLLQLAKDYHIFGTKARSVIRRADEEGIRELVKQQFDLAKDVLAADLLPIIEAEVDIRSTEKGEAEILLKQAIKEQLALLDDDQYVMLELTLPKEDNFYADLAQDKHVVRIVALSGIYGREEATRNLAKNRDMIASFSRALLEGLSYEQSEEAFNSVLGTAIDAIYQASVSKDGN
ncbi:fructose bisphosphate aldolase [Vagococcus acidifermentans]|nr:fructose bisphosphate aldolase [Vagococcus acidifermentans]